VLVDQLTETTCSPSPLAGAFHPAQWLHGLTFEERLNLYRQFPDRLPTPANDPESLAMAREDFSEWREQLTLENFHCFENRLETEDVGEDEALVLMQIPPAAFAPLLSQAPEWLLDLELAEAELARPWTNEKLEQEILAYLKGQFVLSPILPLLALFARRCFEDLSRIQGLDRVCTRDAAQLLKHFLPPIITRLAVFFQRTMALEVNIARMHGSLTAASPEERYREFCARFHAPKARLDFLREYVFLARNAHLTLKNWRVAHRELVERTLADWPEITAIFFDSGILAAGKRVKDFGSPSGDLHRRGQSVRLLELEDGSRVVYKPHSVAIDLHHQDLLRWVNEKNRLLPLATIRVIDRGTHGWVEFVRARPCNVDAELDRFYYRLGAQLGLFYALGTTDIHSENIIACGDQPIIVDLETLLHASLHEEEPKSAADLLQFELSQTVLSVGILPSPILVEGEEVYDPSALGAKAGQVFPAKGYVMEARGTDEMHAVRRYGRTLNATNLPTEAPESTDVEINETEFLRGFREMYLFLREHRCELLDLEKGPLRELARDEVRVILRATRFYEIMLSESWHPDLLRDGLARSRHFDFLWKTMSAALPHYCASEKRQLLGADIPYFSMPVAGREVHDGFGASQPMAGGRNAWEITCERIGRLSERDLAMQTWLVEATLGKARGIFLRESNPPEVSVARALAGREFSEPLELARAVGDLLAKSAVRHRGTTTWVAVQPGSDSHESSRNHCNVAVLNDGLYDGLAGVILFLAQLGMESGNDTYTELAREALASFDRNLINRKAAGSPSVFACLGTDAYLYAQLAVLWNDPGLLARAEQHLPFLAEVTEKDELFDLMSGGAGLIMGLLALDRAATGLGIPSRALETAKLWGNHLLAHSKEAPHGISWPAMKFAKGISHGASGLALALSELGLRSGETHYSQAALLALQQESRLAAGGAWTDRNVNAEGRHQTSWCHGAPGLGLARMRVLHNLRQQKDLRIEPQTELALVRDICEAVEATKYAEIGHSQCLCHGSMGNLELFLSGRQLFSESSESELWGEPLAAASARLMSEIRERGFVSGKTWQTESLGLFFGLSGLGYEALRLAHPNKIPNVLVLEGPVGN
jgi:type 2 lantibiotic biosynthesis protein LanM